MNVNELLMFLIRLLILFNNCNLHHQSSFDNQDECNNHRGKQKNALNL